MRPKPSNRGSLRPRNGRQQRQRARACQRLEPILCPVLHRSSSFSRVSATRPLQRTAIPIITHFSGIVTPCAHESKHCAHESTHCERESTHCAHESTHCAHESMHCRRESIHCERESMHYAHESMHCERESTHCGATGNPAAHANRTSGGIRMARRNYVNPSDRGFEAQVAQLPPLLAPVCVVGRTACQVPRLRRNL